MQTTEINDYRDAEPYLRLIGDNRFKHRIARLRSLFALGLGREIPISQTEFAFWCEMSRETLTAVESGKTAVSTRLAERIYNLTGAELSWLNGRVAEETYGYSSLHAWFPRTMPLSRQGIEGVHSYRHSFYYETIHHILGPLSKRWYRALGEVQLPALVVKEAFDRFTFTGDPDGYPPLWEAFAFAPGPDAMHRALEEGMLRDAPAASPLCKVIKELPPSHIVRGNRQMLSKVCHNLILTLSLTERGVVWKADGCETAETSSEGV